MSDFLFLFDVRRCPNCGHKGKFPKPTNGFCGQCGIRLFQGGHHDFEQMKFYGMLCNFWCYTRDGGWKAWDHFLVKDAKPNPRTLDVRPLPVDYGRRTTPGEVRARGGKLRKADRIKLLGK